MESDAKEAITNVNTPSVDEGIRNTHTSPMKVAIRSVPIVLPIDGDCIRETSGIIAGAASSCGRGTSMSTTGIWRRKDPRALSTTVQIKYGSGGSPRGYINMLHPKIGQ